MNFLITGASGFIGIHLVKRLVKDGHFVRAVVRSSDIISLPQPGIEYIAIQEQTESTDWSVPLLDIDVIVHLAERAHNSDNKLLNSLNEFRRVNVGNTLNLVHQSNHAGVRRFIYLSSIKVNGESTSNGRPFYVDDKPAPEDFYGLTKYESELGLRAMLEKTGGMKFVIIRPPLVYGRGVKANFLNLMRIVSLPLPLPFGAIKNQRSFVFIDNLTDLIVVCSHHPRAINEVFLVSDGGDISTVNLLKMMANALGKSVRLFSIPIPAIYFLAFFFGGRKKVDRLCGSLQVDISFTRERLDWEPRTSMAEGLRKVAQDFMGKSS